MTDHTRGGTPGREAVLGMVLDVVVHALDSGQVDVGPDTALFSSAGRFDSLVLLQLVLRLEQRFGLSIPDEDLDRETFSSPRAIAGYLHGRLQSVAQGEARAT